MAAELQKFGVSVTIHDDAVVVYPLDFHKPAESLFGHGDHRIVMALAVLLTQTGGTIEGAEAVSKSFPTFFEDIKSLGIEVRV
jgi:3-phosphoshikimate 1-carboxyvinyltransferase